MKREVQTASSCSRSLSGGPGQGMEKPTASIQPPAAARGAQLSTTRLQPRESSQGGNPLQYPCLENPMDRGAWLHKFEFQIFNK